VEVVDVFAGGRGWDVFDSVLGIRSRGVETNPDANRTAIAAGHSVWEGGDARTSSPAGMGFVGGKFSPPCQTFARSGGGSGRRDLEIVLDEMEWVFTHRRIDYARFGDMRTGLVLEPLRWTMEGSFEWVVMEQVPDVLPVWVRMAKYLEKLGYSTATGMVHAEQFGAPQVRKRAVLIASRSREARLPVPTHSRFHVRAPDRLDSGVAPWVNMADALECFDDRSIVQRSNHNDGGTGTRNIRRLDQPSVTVTRKVTHWSPADNVNDISRSITVEESSLLQSFPRNYPWQGGVSSQRLQVGNAIPPLLARAILRQVV
jgi:DNA (cytosine-5)-methyltransferase 1